MRYKILGRSGLRVSEIALGTMMMGPEEPGRAGPLESRRIMEAYAERGGNFLDSAPAYNDGQSEKVLGEFVNTDRGRYVVTTKYTNVLYSGIDPRISDDPNRGGNHKKSMVQSVEGSLRRMNLDYIDLLWLHLWDFSVDIEDVMRAVNDLVQQGKVLHFGLCNTPGWVVARGQTAATIRGWEPISALQYQYNLLSRDLELELIPCANALGISVTAFSPLSSGFLTGKYTRDVERESGRLDGGWYTSLEAYSEHDFVVAKKVDEIADKLGTSSAAVALAWVQQRGVLPLVGARTTDQIVDSLACLSVELSDEDMDELSQISATELPWIYNLMQGELSYGIRQMATGGTLDQLDNPGFPGLRLVHRV
ncbi:MAG: aldo/keto reductase [Acidimicrobiaceae bacterium]|nr:aldo/keto reductase [Acidimicrobiaceae bacterium]MYH78195.1 aldo/keto reductase [Acidimicrobiaceae bacterium]MYK65316.1 aldo/keto reductase [Gemmatimonadota bacterium]